ncbi:MAG: Rpn family recombination-promoting nuclease/putative transposase [Bacteroidota bacterium]
MSSPNNPHEKLFKATFSEKDVVIDFINNFLPNPIREKISLSPLNLETVSYIRPALIEFYSYVVYSTLLGKVEIQICLLFEHKSYVPVYPHLQILRYMVEAWFQMIKQNESLKPIIPVIVYHGEAKWEYKPLNFY